MFKKHYFLTYLTLLQHLSSQSVSNTRLVPVSMQPFLTKSTMCSDWSAGSVSCDWSIWFWVELKQFGELRIRTSEDVYCVTSRRLTRHLLAEFN